MKKQFTFNSIMKDGKTIITIDDGRLTISRPGILSKLSHGFSGEKTILIENISAVQLKKAGISRGYIQFIMPGAIEKRSGITNGAIDENIIYFESKKYNEDAETIKLYIENYNLYKNKNKNNSTTINQQVTKNKYDELRQLNDLLADGIISQEEFEKEKEKILNKN